MSRWADRELQILGEYLQNRAPGPLTMEDYQQISRTLPNRSIAAIKKKALEVRRPPPRERPAAVLWTEEEVRRLARRYLEAGLETKTARLASILPEFPGRTAKALATKLGERLPDVYYLRAGVPEEWQAREVEPRPVPPLPQLLEELENGTDGTTDMEGSGEAGRDAGAYGPEEEATPPEPPPDLTRKKFRKAWAKVTFAKRNPKIRKIGESVNQLIALPIDRALREALGETNASTLPEAKKRKRAKAAILAAGILLSQELGNTQRKPAPPGYILTERKMNKLKKHISLAQELRVWSNRGLSRELKAESRQIRKLKMMPQQYIASCNDRLTVLENKYKCQKAKAEAMKTRYKYQKKPNIDSIAPRQDRKTPDLKKTEDHFRKIFRSDGEIAERKASSVFNAWLAKLRAHELNKSFEEQLCRNSIAVKVRQALKRAAPWKAAGEDGIPAALYKIFPSAKAFVVEYVIDCLLGRRRVTETDARARVILLHKGGDVEDPDNFRPIALLNTEYKILTAVIAAMIKQELPEWAIPKEQLAREKVWGTVHGILADKACTQEARMSRRSNWSAWYDFSKAYDSIHHWQLQRLVSVLPVHDRIANTLKNIIKTWSVRVSVGEATTRPIYVRKGVYQGYTMSPLLFILITACIVEALQTNKGINRKTRDKHAILAYMDDFKCRAPSKEGIDQMIGVLRDATDELGLKLNRKKCGIYNKQQLEADENNNNDNEHRERADNEETVFLPKVREGYRYLGTQQLERDTAINNEIVETKVLAETERILDSKLAPSQKINLYNTTIVPAAVYILGILYPDESRATSLKSCKNLDGQIRKLLVRKNLKSKTASRAGIYLPASRGGLGLKSIESEVELQYVRKGRYLEVHLDLQETKKKYQRLARAGWRNPITDAEYVLQKYEIEVDEQQQTQDVSTYCRRVTRQVAAKQKQRLMEEWSRNMHYGRVVAAEENKILFRPTHHSIWRSGWWEYFMQRRRNKSTGSVPSLEGDGDADWDVTQIKLHTM